MLKLTPALKTWLIANANCKADATDAEFKKAALQALMDSKLTEDKLMELTAEPEAKSANELATALTGITALLAKMAGGQAAPAAATPVAGQPAGNKAAGASEGQGGAAGAAAGGVIEKSIVSEFEKLFAGSDGYGTQLEPGAPLVRVKHAHEQYNKARSELRYGEKNAKGQPHPLAGMRVTIGTGEHRKELNETSQLDKAIHGAFLKFQLHHIPGIPRQAKMTDHDKDLMQYALREMEWVGTIGGDGEGTQSTHLRTNGQKLNDAQIKGIIDDSTSGGLYSAPITFDEAVVTTPLLYGEFFPAVNVVPITRGRRVESANISNMSLTGGGFDGTDIPLFTTTAFIAAFNTSIFVVNGGIEIGLDYLTDTPVDVAAILTEQYGRLLLNYLDQVIAAGNGTTQPTGITVASGTISVAGGSATPTVGVYESFYFAVAKKYKQGYPTDRIMFGANETTYMRARAIAVGASDQRRVFGMTHGDYSLMNHKYGISDTLANTKAFFGVMPRFRMYRRMGQTVKATTEGKTLVRANNLLLTARSRWGGQPEDGAAFGVSSTMQA